MESGSPLGESRRAQRTQESGIHRRRRSGSDGFDLAADHPNPPSLRADDHLNIAYRLELGSNRLDDIDVLGAKLDERLRKAT
jgi:hypothetical protein